MIDALFAILITISVVIFQLAFMSALYVRMESRKSDFLWCVGEVIEETAI